MIDWLCLQALPPLVCKVKWLAFGSARQEKLDSCEHRCYQYQNESGRVHMCGSCLTMPGKYTSMHNPPFLDQDL